MVLICFDWSVTNDVRQHHFHQQKIYLLRIFSIDPASIFVKKGLFSSKQHRSTRRNNSLHPGYLTSLVTRTNHNTIQTIDVYVWIYPDGLPRRTDFRTTPAPIFLQKNPCLHQKLITMMIKIERSGCLELMTVSEIALVVHQSVVSNGYIKRYSYFLTFG